jgi:hypothetical protein
MPKMSKPRIGRGRKTVSRRKSGVDTGPKIGATQSAQVYYKAAQAGTKENDLIHILVPKLYRGSKLVESIHVDIGESINVDPAKGGITVTGIQVGRMDPGDVEGGPRGTGVGQVVLSVDRSSKHSTDDVIQGIKSHILPQIEISEVTYVARSTDLPGGSTGPGPGNRPRKQTRRV